MNGAGYIIASWALVSGAIGAYALRLVQRGRTMTTRVPRERRRWMTTEGDA